MFNDKVYVAGGLGPGPLKSVEVYDIQNKTWSFAEDMNHARAGLTMEVVDGQLIVFGGLGGGETTMEIYSKGSGWRVETLQFPHVNHASATVPCN